MQLHGLKGTLRHNAFEKLAALSAQSTNTSSAASDIPRLCSLYKQPSSDHEVAPVKGSGGRNAAKGAMDVRELEVLLALCRAAPSVQNLEHAERLLRQLGPYLQDAHTQSFKSSPYLKAFQLSPWETVSHDLTYAILSLGAEHPSLHQLARSYFDQALTAFAGLSTSLIQSQSLRAEDFGESDADQGALAIKFSLSLLGLLSALSERPAAFTPSERFEVIRQARSILSENFMIKLEGNLSSIRNAGSQIRAARPWRRLLKTYSVAGRPIGAVILQRQFMHYVASSTSLFVSPTAFIRHLDTLGFLLNERLPIETFPAGCDNAMLDELTQLITDSLNQIDAGVDYFQFSSAWQQKSAFSAKASSLTSYLCCSLVNDDIADADILMTWLDAVVADPLQLADEELAQTALKCMAVLAKTSKTFASSLGRTLPRLIVQSKMTPDTAGVAADSLAQVLLLLPQDMQISTLYSLGNVLSVGADPARTNPSMFFDGSLNNKASLANYSQHNQGSAISLVTSDAEETAVIHGTVVQAVVRIAAMCNDEKITALAISMLAQKISRASMTVDIDIVQGLAQLGLRSSPNDLRPLLRLYARVCDQGLRAGSLPLVQAVLDARIVLARGISKSSPLYELYLAHLLDTVVSTTGAIQSDNRGIKGGLLGAEEIAQVLKPLAILVSREPDIEANFEDPMLLSNLSRDAWFNLVAHDYTWNSETTRKFYWELETLAMHTPSLIDKDKADARESGIELNTVLKRNMNPAHTSQQKATLIQAFPSSESEIKGLDYAEVTFLNAAHLIAVLRASTGDCTRTVEYFFDTKFKSGALSIVLNSIAINGVDVYLSRTRTGHLQNFAAPQLAKQLVVFLEGCCHRISKVQQVAIHAVDRIVNSVPSALCQRTSLFAMLELLSLLWTSCLDAETDEYEWKSVYSSDKGNVSIQLSDDFNFRRQTLNTFHKRCKVWVSRVNEIAPLDIKGLLQTYLSEYDDEGAYGHVALGRSFAVEMGCLMPSDDQRLSTLARRGDLDVNSASDFVSQYTTRQEYRAIDHVASHGFEDAGMSHRTITNGAAGTVQDARDASQHLKDILTRIETKSEVVPQELRAALRRAAAILCRTDVDSHGLTHLLVAIPFALFSKQAIKLGISLWTGVLWENAKLESKIFAEVVMGWEASVRKRRGIFSPALRHPDPFYVKEEFAPTDRAAIAKRQQVTHDLIAPHYRLVQFLSSHFHATRLCFPSLERTFYRFARTTLTAIRQSAGQPLAREVHFQIILLTLRILSYSTAADDSAKWTLKDQILSTGLKWFASHPRWSFGNNKLQIKSELRVISEVLNALQQVAPIGTSNATATRSTLQYKQELLAVLLQSEVARLNVWLTPLANDASNSFVGPQESSVMSLLPVAWTESASLAVMLAIRFHSPRVATEVRSHLLRQPSRALDEPEALQFMLGQTLPSDIKTQLKYLLYWAPVNPITATTYFLPAFGNHPFIVQYAVRALESHSIDVTFFYVPQIVQTLRYDVLGYVERYIIETAKFSQLFAHQIIWNMKANAYKDEDSEVPDPVKPTLDKVMSALIESFSLEDRDFYKREFDFFNEVTSISGKLRPFIKRPKPEKKQKIEEELRNIQVDVGVYLPSNPDGVVIGIDRKSGKPLQSHAKAPFMATFRIRKELNDDMEAVEDIVGTSAEHKEKKDNTYEVWQSAIFKVGDDCRQDVLALQMIAAFRGIFNNVGLDVYVFPYRVTATAPGCGVIDVLPNSISRDMLGREQVNGLYEYFISKYGSEDSPKFQAARNNFVKSMAAYSIISYLLQFKDRHNGNIMVDDAGHILHIDFGFCFDIAPGGVKFERAPFKLTPEMVAVMGGSTSSQPFAWFEELCVKAFLASRPYAEKLAHMVMVMLDSGLPCFKPETVKHFRERFVLDKTEREAAEFMRKLVRMSEGNYSTRVYDQFQLLTNGIPY